MMESIYPWQNKHWEYFCKLIDTNILPHAILLSGPTGVGKKSFANLLSASIVCSQTSMSHFPCGECKYCQLFRAGTYPDFTRITPEETESVIAVDDIRLLIDRLNLTPHYDNHKVALIESADNMNMNAANALLKTLEEPPADSVIILVCDKPQMLTATIRSRCQSVIFNVPTQEESINWLSKQVDDVNWEPLLAVTQGAPLQAIKLHETELLEQRQAIVQGFLAVIENNANPVEISAQLDTVPISQGIQWMQGIVLDLVRLKSVENPITLENPDFYRSLLALAPRLEVPLLLDFWDWLLNHKRIFDNSLNRRLFVEGLLVRGRRLLENI